jgi:hypothetical protein
MRLRHLLPTCCVLLLSVAQAQQKAVVPWRPLTDSVCQVLHLSEDQVQRLRVIDEHYNTERHKAQADEQLTATDRDRMLSGWIAAREKEVRGVMTREQFEQWIGRPKRPATKRMKGTNRP